MNASGQEGASKARPQREGDGAGFAALLGGATGIALAPLWVRFSEVGPVATGFYRVFLALACLWPWHVWMARRSGYALAPQSRQEWVLVAGAGACFAGDLAVWHWSIKLTSVANATLLGNLAPLFVVVGAHYWLKEKIAPRYYGGLGFALAGAVLVAGQSWRDAFSHFAGDLFGVATAVFYAGYQLCLSRLRQTVPTTRVLAWMPVFCSPLLALVSLGTEGVAIPPTPRAWVVLVGLAFVSHTLGQGLITYASGHLAASVLSVTLLLQPVLAAAFAWVVLGERVSLVQAGGAAAVLTGVWLAKEAGRKADSPPAPDEGA